MFVSPTKQYLMMMLCEYESFSYFVPLHPLGTGEYVKTKRNGSKMLNVKKQNAQKRR